MRVLISAALLIVVSVVLVHSLPPPFPSPRLVLDSPYEELLKDFGTPADLDPNSTLPPALRSAKSVAWVKPWLLAKWTLRIDYRGTSFGLQAEPDSASRCLETKWSWVNWILPCEAAFRARVRA